MNNYHKIKLNNCKYDFLVIAISYENPINYFICNDFVPFLSKGNIVFDLTLINGKGYNQYAFADVENHKIIPQSLTVSSKVDKKILDISKKFLALNPDIIEKSILPKALKFVLLKE
ncbi:MAG TPA: type II toxin-antitoxin system RnlB family antitoxin [Ruminococcus sp.]